MFDISCTYRKSGGIQRGKQFYLCMFGPLVEETAVIGADGVMN